MTTDIDGPEPGRDLGARLRLWRDRLLANRGERDDDYPAEGLLRRPVRPSRVRGLLARFGHLERPAVGVVVGLGVVLAAIFVSLQAALPRDDRIDELLARRTIHYVDAEGGLLSREGAPRAHIDHLQASNPNIIDAVVAIEDRSFFKNDGVNLWAFLRILRDAFQSGGGSTLSMQLAKNLYGLDRDDTWDDGPKKPKLTAQQRFQALKASVRAFFKPKSDEEKAAEAKARKAAKKAEAEAAKSRPFRIRTPLVCRPPGMRTVCRKIYEVDLAYRFTRQKTKEQLLAVYFQIVMPHPGVAGVESAAQLWFGKELDQLSVAEAARIAAALQGRCASPVGVRYPDCDPDRPRRRAIQVIKAMQATGAIKEAEAKAALAENETMEIVPASPKGLVVTRWMHRYVRSTLPRAGDMTVRTTLEPRLMQAGREALEVAPPEVEGALVAIDPRTGAVRAMVPGRGARIWFNQAVDGRRPAGSVLKPLLYAAALERGATPGSLCDDAPYPGGPDNSYTDPPKRRPLWEALQKSSNQVTIRLGEQVGAEAMNEISDRVGMRYIGDGQKPHPFPSGDRLAWMGEGAQANIRLLDIAGAYAPFANGGLAVQPYGVASYVDGAGKSQAPPRRPPVRVLTPEVAGQMRAMLRRVVTSGTGVEADVPGLGVAGKTGTTQGWGDGWFVGFTDDLVAAVWLGQDTAREGAKSRPVSGHDAARVVGRFLSLVEGGRGAPSPYAAAPPPAWPNGPLVATMRPGALSCDAGLQ